MQTPDNCTKMKMKEITSKLKKYEESMTRGQPKTVKCRKIRLCNYEDEDIVNREESYMTEEQNKTSRVLSYQDDDNEQEIENECISESPKITPKEYKLDNYFTETNQRYCTINIQPCGDQEEEIMVDMDDNSDTGFKKLQESIEIAFKRYIKEQ